MEAGLFLLVAAVCVGLSFAIYAGQRRKIAREVASRGWELISVERRMFGGGPWKLVARGSTVYCVTYRTQKGELRSGWVLFSAFFYTDWRL